jgi:hypothetical protein
MSTVAKNKISFLKLGFCLICLLTAFNIKGDAQKNNHLPALNAYLGTWVIFKDVPEKDTLCVTRTAWSKDGTRLLASQLISGEKGSTKDSCFYTYDSLRNIYSYYETDETGQKITSTSEIVIEGRTWIYMHHIGGYAKWRTLNLFNEKGDQINFQTQRSDDGGKTWTTTRRGTEYKVK